MKRQDGAESPADPARGSRWQERGDAAPGAPPGSPGRDGGAGSASEPEVPPRGSPLRSSFSSEPALERARPGGMEGSGRCQADRAAQYNMSYRCLLRQNQVLLTALEELQSRCAVLKKENSLLHKSCFPETQEKVKHLKRKNAELAVIAKRLEERARKLQEANLRVVNAPVTVKGSCAGLCKKALARQRATDLREQASALLEKDKQISSLQQECHELQAKVLAGKEGPPCLPLMDFRHLLRESQKEVLRLQRQIALKNFKASLGSQGPGGSVSASTSLGSPVPTRATYRNGFPPSRRSRQREELSSIRQTGPRALPSVQGRVEHATLPSKKAVSVTRETKQQIQQLEFELRKKRKQCENLEHEVRKKHKRFTELEIRFQEIQNDNVRLLEENTLLQGQVEWTEKVESENADLRLQVAVVTEERDSALQKSQELQNRLESLGQALKHMKDVAGRRQQLELEHEKALQALQRKQDEVRQLQQAQAEARKEHEGAVQLLEAHVREREDECRTHTEQFRILSQELQWFHLQTGKRGPPWSSSLCTPETPFAPCQPAVQLLDGPTEKDSSAIVPVLPRLSSKTQDEGGKGLAPTTPGLLLEPPTVSAVDRSPETSTPPPLVYKRALKKLESQSSSSRSESLHNSPKCCPTPEVDTASEMEELDIDSISLIPEPESQGPVKLRVFLARYSYNPFDGPNENPEAELPLTAGEYIYVYGEMDDDGFFEGELMDGRRGLVPSNFVERVSDDGLMTFLPQELLELSQSSPLERSYLSTSLSSGERSDFSTEELSTSTAPSRIGGDQEEAGDPTAVPYPRKVALLKQFGSSILVGWEPPLLPSGHSEIQSYNVYVEAELQQTVKAGSPTKAMIEKLDLKAKSYRVSVQAVWERGCSDRLRCTFLVGHEAALAPTQLRLQSITATSAEISWLPSNSNFPHTLYLNGEARDTTKASFYWYTFCNLNPSTSYVATVEAQPPQAPWDPSQEGHRPAALLAEIHFTTASAGSPDAPLDVRVERGPSAGILVISWLPVTIDAEGSSNGVRVTGYAVYADGQKVMEVTSPTAGSVLVEVSQLQILQVCREVSVRTVSLYGESVDSVPAQIPLAIFGETGPASPTGLLHGEEQAVAKIASEKPLKILHVEASPSGRSSPARALSTLPLQTLPPSESGAVAREEWEFRMQPPGSLATTYLATTRVEALEEPKEDPQEPLPAAREPELESSGSSAGNSKTCGAGSVDPGLEGAQPEGGGKGDQGCLGAKPSDLSTLAMQGDSGQSERGAPGPLAGPSGRKLLKETSRDDSAVMVPRVRREQGEKRSDPGNRPLTLLTDHSRGSDLSDIMEEEEEEEEEEEDEEGDSQHSGRQGDSKWNPRDYNSKDSGEKLDPGDTDSDEEILERILEMPLQNNCSKALFSIPEVAEEEEEEDWEHVPNRRGGPAPEKKTEEKAVLEGPPFPVGRTSVPVGAQPKSHQRLLEQPLPGASVLQECRRGASQECRGGNLGKTRTYPELPGSWTWEGEEQQGRPSGGGRASQWRRAGRSQASPRRKAASREQGHSTLGPSHPQAGGGLYRAHSLKENLDVISSLGVEDDAELYSWARPRPHPRRGAAPAASKEPLCHGLPRCPSPESLEIDVEYDSDDEQDLTITSTLASQMSSDGRADGSPTDCEEDGWSDCSSRSGSVPSSGPRELRRCSSWEDESTEWSGSPSHSPGHPCRAKRTTGGSEERSRSLERSPSLWRAVPERPRKGRMRLPAPAWVARHRDPQSMDYPSWQAPVRRRGRQPLRKGQEVAAAHANSCPWGSPPSRTMDDNEDSARLFVALFDYDPVSMSPNPDAAEEELPFQEGQILKIYGHKDADGFYRGECAGRTGYVPCNMVSEVQVDSACARKQLLQDGHIPRKMLAESLGNGVFSPPPPCPATRPPKPRRSKKVERRDKEEDENLCFGGHESQDLSSEEDMPRTVLAVFDCSPSLDAEVELKLGAGDVVTVLRSRESDGFYYGEANGQKGLAPSDFLEAVPTNGAPPGEQKMRKRRVQ